MFRLHLRVLFQALLESMEQQSVTVAKSGLICSLPARTSILAAANPIGGQYNNSKTVTENLNISQPILSRFDLIFLLLDKPDKVNRYLCIIDIYVSKR
jgi:DNA helicase MCM8